MTKKITVGDIHDYLARFAPPSLAEEWDNVGLQVGTRREPVRGILVSLDVTEAALWEAVEHRANLLITHHPLLLSPLKRLDDATSGGRLARLAVQADLTVLSFHTNLDSTVEGLNDLLGRKLGIRKLKPLLPSRDSRVSKAGLGRIGTVPPTTLKKFLPKIVRALQLKNLRSVGDSQHPIRRVAVMTGSGGGFFSEARRAGADALVTGDVKYHHALDALAEGIALIDVGHFAGEMGMVPLIAKKLRQWKKLRSAKIKVWETQVGFDPFQFWKWE